MSNKIERIKILQRMVGANDDGIIGNETLTKFKNKYNVPSKSMVAQFFANVDHETGGFTIGEESLSYSSKRIMDIFGVDKHSAKVTQLEASILSGKPYELAERVYGIGNKTKSKELGNTSIGDGWKYRGRGALQITGKYSYNELQKSGLIDLGDDVVENPDLVSGKYFWSSAINYFNKRKLWNLVSSINDDDTERLRRRVNGGLNGIREIKSKVKVYFNMFK